MKSNKNGTTIPLIGCDLGHEPSGHFIPSGRALIEVCGRKIVFLFPTQRDEWIDTARATSWNVAS